jgi:hypothetical protein
LQIVHYNQPALVTVYKDPETQQEKVLILICAKNTIDKRIIALREKIKSHHMAFSKPRHSIASETFPDPPEPSKAVSNSSAKSLVSTLIATKVEAKETLPFVNTETEHQSLISKYQISSGTFSKMDCSASSSTANITLKTEKSEDVLSDDKIEEIGYILKSTLPRNSRVLA